MPEKIRFFENKKVLITGGLGFIGSNLAIKLAKAGAIVTLLDAMIEIDGLTVTAVPDAVSSNLVTESSMALSLMREPSTSALMRLLIPAIVRA